MAFGGTLRSANSPSVTPYGIGGDANTIWHCDRSTDKIYELSKKYPEIERFNLRSQLISSVTSIPLNIAEGSGRGSKKDFARYIRTALGSLLETDTNLKISIRRKYLSEEDYALVDKNIEMLYYKLISFERVLKTKHQTSTKPQTH